MSQFIKKICPYCDKDILKCGGECWAGFLIPNNPFLAVLKETKNCSNSKCTQINPQSKEQFGKNTRCRSCVNEELRAKRIANPKYGAHKKVHKRRKAYHKYKLDYCQACNFKAVHTCQLDVDHIDGNHSNNLPENLQTLCANCHRLKTEQDRIKFKK